MIIGLIVAGVVAGQSLIRQAQIRGMTAELSQYQTALNAFKLEYNALAGDMSNASAYWGVTNGDGDGQLEDAQDGQRMWVHLASAGLISGNYSVTGAPTVVGISAAKSSAVPRAGWGGKFCQTQASCGASSEFVDPGNYLVYGANGAAYNSTGVINGREIFSFDTKIDDGLPARGNIRSNNCLDPLPPGTTPYDKGSPYDMDYSSKDCRFFAKILIRR